MERRNPIPLISTYANGLNSGQGDLDLDTLPALFKALHEAWEIACEGFNVKHGDTDEADNIGGVITHIWEKYQGKATLEQRKQWQDARTGK